MSMEKVNRIAILAMIEDQQKDTVRALEESDRAFEELVAEVDTEEVAVICQNQTKVRKSPSPWAHPRHGTFWEMDIPGNTAEFFKDHIRVDRAHFNMLVEQLHGLAKTDTTFREAIPLEKRIAIALYTLGSSSEYRGIGAMFGVSACMVGKILHEFCAEVRRVLSAEYLPADFITEDKLKECVKGFEVLGFPQCFGAIDGCHIGVRPTASEATDYYNFKGWHSTILLALVDYRYRLLFVSVGAPGRCHDSFVYENSDLKKMVESSEFLEANSKRIAGVDVPVVLIGDSAFRFSRTLMKPYPFCSSSKDDEKAFNYALSKSRRVVENAFGHLKARFRRMGKGLDNRCDKAPNIIMACCILHNYLNCHNSSICKSWMEAESEMEIPESENTTIDDSLPTAEKIRKALAKFISEKQITQP